MSQYVGKTRLAYSRAWHLVDINADTRPLGRLASQIAIVLMGKHKPIYDPSTDCGDYVVVLGCHDLHTTGKKREQKKYYSHSTRPGSLKEMTLDKMMEKWGGSEVLRRAVRGMLPKNRLRDDRMARLKCESGLRLMAERGLTSETGFEGAAHPYKENLIHHKPTRSITQLPEVQAALQEQKPPRTSTSA